MGFWNRIVGAGRAYTVALIAIEPDRIRGAYVRMAHGQVPRIDYALEVRIERHVERESVEEAMQRALKELGERLISDGAPVLVRRHGSGNSDAVLVSVSPPWQKTRVEVAQIAREEAFTVTKDGLEKAIQTTVVTPEGYVLAEDTIVTTTINGYETEDPYGKNAKRVSITVLCSFIQKPVAHVVASVLRSLFHTPHIFLTASAALNVEAIRLAFPHENDCLILDTSSAEELNVMVVRRGRMVEAISGRIANGSPEDAIQDALITLARTNPLPPLLFFVPSPTSDDLHTPHLDKKVSHIWLHGRSPAAITITPAHVAGSVKHLAEGAAPNLPLLLMAIYAEHALLPSLMVA